MRLTFHHAFLAVVLGLAGASGYFTFHVVRLKRGLASGLAEPLKSGQAATLETVLDGDEVAVRVGSETLRVRLLGIYAFDPTTADPVEQAAGLAALRHLEGFRGQPVNVVFDELKQDNRKRILAYLEKDGKDLGEGMLAKGLVVAYTKYPVPRMNAYLLAEGRASKAALGIWADPQVARRATDLKALWETQRRRGD